MAYNNSSEKLMALDAAAAAEVKAGVFPVKVVMTLTGGKKPGFKYTAVFEDGREEVARAKATRAYPKAYVYKGPVATGKSGWAAYFSFGKSPTAYAGAPVKTYTVETVDKSYDPDSADRAETYYSKNYGGANPV